MKPITIAWRAALLLSLIAAPIGAAEEFGDFHRLAEMTSQKGALNVTLVATALPVIVDGVHLDAYTFNGEYGGPVLRLSPGDRLKIHLVNHIDQPINLHFHGSHGSPLGHGDNVFTSVKPGDAYDYQVDIPKGQPPGLYWYHTHVHGRSEDEINRGLSGAMIIEGIEGRVPDTIGLKQRLLVLKTFNVTRPEDPEVKRLHGLVQSVNGVAHSQILMKAGATEFWRISNQAANDYYHLSAPGFHFRIVGIDGSPTNRDLPADTIDIPPSGTMEILASAPAAGDYALLSGSTPTGTGRGIKLNRELATLKVEGDLPGGTPLVPVLHEHRICGSDLRSAKISEQRLVTFSQKPGEEVYLINGKTFDHHRIDARIALGSIEQWTIRNDTDDMHVFHIHQLHFQVVAINGQPQPFDGVIDDVRVPERGSVTLRMAFTDPRMVGRFVYHCHVLKHEDKGMMAVVEVYDPKTPASRRSATLADEDHASHG